MNCIIIDDELPGREELKYYINHFNEINIATEFDNAVDALKYLENNTVDVIFLDINMPNLDGFNFGKIINNFSKKPLIVFVTAYKEYALDAFEINAFDYILKPYSKERINSTLEKLLLLSHKTQENEHKGHTKVIPLRVNEKIKLINCEQILFCKAEDREVLAYTELGLFRFKGSFNDLLLKLDTDIFFRTHRSYVVNINKIKEIIPWFNNTYILKFNNINEDVPVSRKNIKEFRHLIGL